MESRAVEKRRVIKPAYSSTPNVLMAVAGAKSGLAKITGKVNMRSKE